MQGQFLDFANDLSKFAGAGAKYFKEGVLNPRQQPFANALSVGLGFLVGVNASKYARPAHVPGEPLISYAVASVFIAASAAFAQATFAAADASAEHGEWSSTEVAELLSIISSSEHSASP